MTDGRKRSSEAVKVHDHYVEGHGKTTPELAEEAESGYECCCTKLSADECCEPCSTGTHTGCVGPLV